MFSMSYSLLCSVDRHGGVSTKETHYRTEQQYYLYFLTLYFLFWDVSLFQLPLDTQPFYKKNIP